MGYFVQENNYSEKPNVGKKPVFLGAPGRSVNFSRGDLQEQQVC
jgi:hypothetical protein